MTKQDGLRLRAQRRARVRRIRARVIGGSIALFLAVWMLITVVLVTGHDPALARKTSTQTATPATTTATSSVSSGATSSSTGSGSSGVSGVTSSQS
ncbi:MAG TPA: hypothetical protein VMF14_07620 [Solirubrobacteraceae bacterium]|nr:hypothetical protein [Solirubrobacteraceae bacterium]